MKCVTSIVALLGIICLVLGIFEHMRPVLVMNVSAGGYVRGAEAFFLLGIMMMMYKKTFCCCCEKKDEAPKA